MADAVIVSTARTPIGRAYRGAFNNTHGADSAATSSSTRWRGRAWSPGRSRT